MPQLQVLQRAGRSSTAPLLVCVCVLIAVQPVDGNSCGGECGTGASSTIGGGTSNIASGDTSVVGGGTTNIVAGEGSTIAGRCN